MTLFPTELVKCWHIADWPEDDQRLWHHHITPVDPFAEADEPGSHYGSTLRADSRLKVRKGYGRWLSFLASRGWLDATVPALDRVTVPHLRAYCRSLLREGNQSSTVIGRFWN